MVKELCIIQRLVYKKYNTYYLTRPFKYQLTDHVTIGCNIPVQESRQWLDFGEECFKDSELLALSLGTTLSQQINATFLSRITVWRSSSALSYELLTGLIKNQ